MKKMFIVTIALLSLLAFVSCGKKDETSATNTFSLQGSGS